MFLLLQTYSFWAVFFRSLQDVAVACLSLLFPLDSGHREAAPSLHALFGNQAGTKSVPIPPSPKGTPIHPRLMKERGFLGRSL